MPINGLGAALKKLRERRTLSQRELAELSDVDNAYISRLEVGEKVNPTPETIAKLLRVLKAPERDASILKWLAQNPSAWPELVIYTLETPSVPFDHFVTAAGSSFRGDARPSPEVLLDRVKRMYEE
jgi:transcriptional regulator with XRE-family HTH domain